MFTDTLELKLQFLQRVLTDSIEDKSIVNLFFKDGIYPDDEIIKTTLSSPAPDARMYGKDWPEFAHTMIGLKRLNNLKQCLDYTRLNNIEGDFIETGVWRGGASIFVKKYLQLYNIKKKVFVADSFKGLPPPQIQEDSGDIHHTFEFLRVSLNQVKDNFKLYRALDEDVIFLEGWFEDTLPNNPEIQKLSILRMDGDMFKSTMDVFNACYPKLVNNGRVIIDDYCLLNCKNAVEKFRNDNLITDPIEVIDQCGIFWTKNEV